MGECGERKSCQNATVKCGEGEKVAKMLSCAKTGGSGGWGECRGRKSCENVTVECFDCGKVAKMRLCVCVCVCVISYLYPATCSLEGYGSGSAAAEATAVGFFGIHILSQTGLACHSRASQSPSPTPICGAGWDSNP